MANLSQKLEQKQKLSPRQILESNIIQLNYHNLENRIVEELEKNPMLEIEEDDESVESNEDEDSFNIEDLESSPEDFDISYSNKENNIENMNDGLSINLSDDIVNQLYDINYTDDNINIAKEILGNLNDQGYLEIDLDLISDRMNEPLKAVEKVVNDIKQLDPPGIASSSIQDCLLVQLKLYYPNEKLCIDIIENSFNDYVNKNFNKILKKHKCTEEDLAESNQIISVLNPTPAINYANLTNEHIVPDILIERVEKKNGMLY